MRTTGTPCVLFAGPQFSRYLDVVSNSKVTKGPPRANPAAGQVELHTTSTVFRWAIVTVAIVACLDRVLQELNYEKSVTNEIACLRVFSHPGIARLISAFRWRDGAYLVLEYASRGDLHGHIKQHGSLSEASTRSVHMRASVELIFNYFRVFACRRRQREAPNGCTRSTNPATIAQHRVARCQEQCQEPSRQRFKGPDEMHRTWTVGVALLTARRGILRGY